MRFALIIALGFPLLEMVGIYWIWGHLGPWTLAWLLAALLLGVAIIRQEGAGLGARLAHGLLQEANPVKAVLGTGLRFLAGVLLILPGAISDALALMLLLVSPGRLGGPPPGKAPPDPARNQASSVIEGEYRRED